MTNKFNKFKYISQIIAIALFTGCGGGGETFQSTNTVTLSGTAIDGLIKSATVCIDTNQNNLCDSGEPTTTTDTNGNYSFDVTKNSGTKNIIVIGGIDTATNSAFTGILKEKIAIESTPITSINITPLTTTATLLADEQNIPISSAKQTIATKLGLTLADISKNPLLDVTVYKKTQEIVQATKVFQSQIQKDDTNQTNNQNAFNHIIKQIALTLKDSTANGTLNIDTLATKLETTTYNNQAVVIPADVKTFATNYIAEVNTKLASVTTTTKLNEIQNGLEIHTSTAKTKIKNNQTATLASALSNFVAQSTATIIESGTVPDTSTPVFTSDSTFTVAENQTSAFTTVATDNSTVTYSLGGTDANSFNINSTTGVITFKVAPDYETKTSYSLTVTATDSSNNISTQNVTVEILNILGEYPAILKNISVSIPENQKSGFVYSPSIIKSMGDSPITQIKLSGFGNENFEVTTNGELKLKISGDLDYETTTSYLLQAVATDTYGISNTADINISITNHQIDNLIGVIDMDWQSSGYGGYVGEIVDKYGNTYSGKSKYNHDGQIDTSYIMNPPSSSYILGSIISSSDGSLFYQYYLPSTSETKINTISKYDENLTLVDSSEIQLYYGHLVKAIEQGNYIYYYSGGDVYKILIKLNKTTMLINEEGSFSINKSSQRSFYIFEVDNNENVYIVSDKKITTVDYDLVIQKYNSIGELDSTFGTNGVFTVDTIPENGLIKIIYHDTYLYAINSFNIKKISNTGALVSTFDISNTVNAYIYLDKLYILKSANNTSSISRYDLNANIDTTFGINGILSLSQASSSLVFNNDGDLFVIGTETVKIK